MTDFEMARWLGIETEPNWRSLISRLSLPRRLAFERMARLEQEVTDWLEGRGTKPNGVLIDFPRRPFADG